MISPILVAYATRADSTREVAEFVGRALAELHTAVEVRPVNKVKDIRPYQAVIIGTAVRMGKIMPEAVSFAQKHALNLRQKPAAYFTVCLTMKEDTPENRATAAGYLEPLCDIHTPVSLGLFGGRVEYARLGPLFRFFFSRDKTGAVPEGDWRDWDAIRNWALALATALEPMTA